jgi:hypothetical protein
MVEETVLFKYISAINDYNLEPKGVTATDGC